MKAWKSIVLFAAGTTIGFVVGYGVSPDPAAEREAAAVEETRHMIDTVKSGDDAAILALLDGLYEEGGRSVRANIVQAFSPKYISGPRCAAVVEKKWNETEVAWVRGKLAMILGQNGTTDAVALLCRLAENEKNVTILANITIALRRSHPTRRSLKTLKAMKGDSRAPLNVYGAGMVGSDGSVAPLTRWAEAAYHEIRIALNLDMKDPDFAW